MTGLVASLKRALNFPRKCRRQNQRSSELQFWVPQIQHLEARLVLSAPSIISTGGPYGPLAVGEDLMLNASATDADNAPFELTYEWDLNGDGISGDIPPGFDGMNMVPYSMLIGLGIMPGSTVTIGLSVSDPEDNHTTAFTTLTLQENMPPMVDAGGPYILGPMRELSLFGMVMDPDGGFSPELPAIEWDLNDDGIYGDGLINSEFAMVSLSELQSLGIATVGTHTIHLRATDPFGGVATASTTLEITNQAPTDVSAGPPGTNYGPVQPGQDLQLSASAMDFDDDPFLLTYQWDLNNDGLYSENISGSAPIVSYAQLVGLDFVAGLNPIRVRVTDPFGASAVSDIAYVEFAGNLPPVVNANGPYTINDHSFPISLSGAGTIDPDGHSEYLIYEWDLNGDGVFGDASGPGGDAMIDAEMLRFLGVTTTGPHTISLRVTDEVGDSATASTILTINNLAPTLADPGLMGPIFPGDPLWLSGFASDPDDPSPEALTYEWDLNGDGQFEITGNGVSVPYSELLGIGWTTGDNTVVMRVTDPYGASLDATGTVSFTATAPPVASIGGPYSYYGSPITLDATGSEDPDPSVLPGMLTFAWDLDNDGEFDDANTPTVSMNLTLLTALGLNATGVYPIAVRVSDEYGATSTAATTLTLSDTPPVTNAGTPDQAFGLNGLVA
ncbi:MAG: hypothetical protein KDB01_05975, partial [Planctomycetaceae bacterium]|nr:hypothetical protein [Planctomycetaceae bacterium]